MENNQENGKILICGTISSERDMLKSILEKANYINIFESESGPEAVEAYKSNVPDVVFVDIEMSQMSGLDTLVHLKMIDKNACVIMMSTLSQQEQVIEALQAGAADFIMKPFRENDVLETIAKRCQRKVLWKE